MNVFEKNARGGVCLPTYISPQIEIVTVSIEAGFASSGVDGDISDKNVEDEGDEW